MPHKADTGPATGEAAVPPREIELKLTADPADLDAIASCEAVAACARNRGITRHLRAVYYDTAEHALRKAGFVLRVRKVGARFVMTAKSDMAQGELIARGEWETPVTGWLPDVAMFSERPPAAFFEAIGGAPLEPVLVTDVKRRLRRLDVGGAAIEMAVDTGTIAAAGRSQPVSEIELELKTGPEAQLYELALAMTSERPADFSLYSKAERGFDLAFDRPPVWTKATRPAIDGEGRLDDALAVMLAATLRHLVENKPAALDGRDPEGVHQVRVALRRMRSILKIVAGITASTEAESLAGDAKWLADAHGDARSWDVFLDETLPPLASACGEPAVEALRENAGRAREDGYAKVREALRDPRAQNFQLRLAQWIAVRGWREGASDDAILTLADPAARFAASALERQHRKVEKRGRGFARLAPEARHELRLAVKKLRYVADFLLPLCGREKKAAAYAKALSRLQDGLGRLQDMATTGALLESLEAPDAGRDLHVACGLVRGWQAREALLADAETGRLWKTFTSVRKLWA